MFLLLLSCSRLITHGDVALASSRVLHRSCSSATSCGPTSPSYGCATRIDALGDDETQLQLTATTRGVMVPGIMDAYDIAPTLHFVEPGLQVNAEEWIKVMDECMVPNCIVLMEPGRKFLLILDNAPSHATRLACEQHCEGCLMV